MSHERQDIRNQAVTQLIAGNTGAAGRVFKTRMSPIKEGAELPAISVYTLDEDVDSSSADTAPRRLIRNLDLVIDAWVQVPADGSIDDAVDDLALQIETAMDADIYLGKTARFSFLSRTEIAVSVDGDKISGCAHMTYSVEYRTDVRLAPPGDTFDKADVTYPNLGKGPINPANQAEDLVTGINSGG